MKIVVERQTRLLQYISFSTEITLINFINNKLNCYYKLLRNNNLNLDFFDSSLNFPQPTTTNFINPLNASLIIHQTQTQINKSV